jgi:hypothetical protein
MSVPVEPEPEPEPENGPKGKSPLSIFMLNPLRNL